MSIDQILNFLGLAVRADKAKTGKSVIASEIKKENLKLVIVVDDASDNTAKLITNKCKNYRVPFRKFGNRNELGIVLGKGGCVNVGATDPGFAERLLSVVGEYHKERLYE